MKLTKLFWIGLTITTSIVIFVFGLMYLKDISLNQPSMTFTVIFDNVQGLNEGDDVNMLGKTIGKVRATRIDAKEIAVEIGIYQDFSFNIPIDSKIEVKSDGLMGSKFIAIEPGNNTKKSILDGDVVSGTREADFSEITPEIQPITRDIAAFTRNLRAILDDKQKDEIRSTLSNVESISAELDSLVKDIHSLVGSDMSNLVLSNEDRNNITKLFKNLNSTSKNLDDITSNKLDKILDNIDELTSNQIVDAINNINEATDESKEKIDDITDQVSKILDNYSESSETLSKILKDVDKGKGSLGRLVKGDELADNINRIAENANGFVDDLRAIIKDFNENKDVYLKAYIRSNNQVKREDKKRK